jgi:hypothetical protein
VGRHPLGGAPASLFFSQTPAVHISPAAHFVAQSPQWPLSVDVSTQPPPHDVRPVLHASWQRPPTHETVPFATDAHTARHCPQFDPSVARSTQTLLQLVVPPPQMAVQTPPVHA